jgi:hypothetical protein
MKQCMWYKHSYCSIFIVPTLITEENKIRQTKKRCAFINLSNDSNCTISPQTKHTSLVVHAHPPAKKKILKKNKK